MRGPASRRNRFIYSHEFPDGEEHFPAPAPNRRIPVIIRSQSHTSHSPDQEPLVQDQRAHIAGELTPLEEYSALEHDRQLTQLHSRLAEESTRDQKGHYDPDLDQLHTAIDSIFDSLPTLVQLPDFSEPSSVLFQ